MKCYYCGAELDATSICPICGEDVSIWKRICAMSNRLYNEGLEKAQVRDLSAAAEALRLSLRCNKSNVPARNLLGLIYYEMGDPVAALSEWAISKSMDAEDNQAQEWIDKVQEDAGRLAVMTTTLKNYNQALAYCHHGNYDLAVIQLKNVVSANPKFVKAQQLLALLHIREEDYDAALKCLKRAAQVDAGSTITLRYTKYCREHRRSSQRRRSREEREEETVAYRSGNDVIITPTTITDNSTVRNVLYLLLGAAIGVAIVCFLVIPQVRQRANTRAAAQVVETDQSLAVRDQTIQTLETEKEALNQEIRDAADATESAGERTRSYQALLDAYELFVAEDYTGADLALVDVDRDLLEADGQALYDEMVETMESTTLATAYESGMTAYNARDYEEAIHQFLSIVETVPDYEDGMAAYYLAYSYNYSGDYENALKWFAVVQEYATGQTALDTSSSMVANLEAEGYTAAE